MPTPAYTPTDCAATRPGVAGVLERLPGAFEEDALLRIEDLRFARREAEEAGVEMVRVLEDRPLAHIAWVRAQRCIDAGGVEIGVAEGLERLDAVANDCARTRRGLARPGNRPASPTMATA